MNTTVQPKGWQAALPRPEYKSYKPIQAANNSWYEIYEVLPGVFALYEPGHFQEVISYLITGTKKALLWDTGMGFAPIRPVVEALTQLPVIVVNSHLHFDHVGGNWEFDQVLAYPDPTVAARSKQGYGEALLNPMLAGDSLAKPLPAGFDANHFIIKPWQHKPLQINASASQESASSLFTGQQFDLGGRSLEVLHTPGHTADSIMLLDKQQRILFTGDTVYPAALYAHYHCDQFGNSSLNTYAKTMHNLVKLMPTLDHLCCSHNVPLACPELLKEIAAAFEQIKGKKVSGRPDSDGLLRFEFPGFAIIVDEASLLSWQADS
jgi:glyoxylase-like metal-dependent hydrolase (beta-lactamase superfamily II)